MKDGVDIFSNKNLNDEKNEQYKNYLKRNNILNIKANNYDVSKEGGGDIYQNGNSRGYGGRNNQNYNRGYYKQGSYKEGTMAKNLKDENTTEKKDDFDQQTKPLEKQNFHWHKYLGYLICCGRNDKKIASYEDFRAKMISEENIIQNYLDIYKLLKACNIKKTVFNNNEN